MTGEGLRLDGQDDYVRLPNDLMRGLDAITVSVQVNMRSEQSGYYFIWGLGRTGSNGQSAGGMFITGSPLRGAISATNYEHEAEARSTTNLPPNEWHTVTYVIDSRAKTSALYLDGRQLVGRTTGEALISPASIGGGSTGNNYIGRSLYTTDKFFAGSVRDFRIYSRALSAAEVPLLLGPPQSQPQQPPVAPPSSGSRIDQALNSIDLGNLNDVRGNLNLPKKWEDISINWGTSNPAVISTDGVVTLPATGTLVTLVAVIDYNGQHKERVFVANVRAAP